MKLIFLFSLTQVPPSNAEYINHINGYQYKNMQNLPFKVGDYVEFISEYKNNFTFTKTEDYNSKYQIVELSVNKSLNDDDTYEINVIAELDIDVPHKTYCLAWFKQPIKLNVKKL